MGEQHLLTQLSDQNVWMTCFFCFVCVLSFAVTGRHLHSLGLGPEAQAHGLLLLSKGRRGLAPDAWCAHDLVKITYCYGHTWSRPWSD